MFRNKSAWFSSSVPQACHIFLDLGGWDLADWRTAAFLFSEDATCADTLRIFESKDYLWKKVAVFHSLFLSACEKRQSVRSVCIGHYVLPPASVQEEVRHVVGRLIWESEDEQSVEKGFHKSFSCQTEDQCSEVSRSNSSEPSDSDASESEALYMLTIHLVTRSQGTSALTTCRNIQVMCGISTPDVSGAPTVKPTAARCTHKQSRDKHVKEEQVAVVPFTLSTV